jgi:hypothetical protein
LGAILDSWTLKVASGKFAPLDEVLFGGNDLAGQLLCRGDVERAVIFKVIGIRDDGGGGNDSA